MKWFLIALLLLVAACQAEEKVEEKAEEERHVEEENEEMAEGDMVLSPYQRFLFNNGLLNSYSSARNIWDKRYPIPFEIESSLKGTYAENVIYDAMRAYHANTCLKFTRRTTQSTYLSFYMGGGCSSPVGYGRGKRRISLARGCWRKGTVMHEIGHSIGLYHEQSRTDRDSYITILWSNIKSRAKFNFNKASGTSSHGTPYDFDSMMHYPGKAFSVNGGYTIKTKDPQYQSRIGQRTGFSPTDIKQINAMYSC